MKGGCDDAIVVSPPTSSTERSASCCTHLYSPIQSVVQVLQPASKSCLTAPPLVDAAPDVHIPMRLPAETSPPASDSNNSADRGAQLLSDIAATQLPQQQAEAEVEAHEPRLDCQGLRLLSSDRPLHWEAFVRHQHLPASQGTTFAACKFLEEAAVADCNAILVPGTALDPQMFIDTFLTHDVLLLLRIAVFMSARSCLDA